MGRRGWGLSAWASSRSLSSLQGSSRTTWRAKCCLTSTPGDSYPWEMQEMQESAGTPTRTQVPDCSAAGQDRWSGSLPFSGPVFSSVK